MVARTVTDPVVPGDVPFPEIVDRNIADAGLQVFLRSVIA